MPRKTTLIPIPSTPVGKRTLVRGLGLPCIQRTPTEEGVLAAEKCAEKLVAIMLRTTRSQGRRSARRN
jgi:hypothetical protein